MDHTLGAMPTKVYIIMTDSLRDIDYSWSPTLTKQLKTQLMSRYSKARWTTRAFEQLKIKPNNLMRQMKALLPTDSRPCTTFMAMFLLAIGG